MAESLVSIVAENVLKKIGSLVLDEVCLAWNVKTDVQKLEDTLNTIKAVILDAEEQQSHSEKLKVWLGKLKDVLYDAEDVLDEFEVEALRRQVLVHGSILRKVHDLFSCSNSFAFHFMMGHKIQKIRERLDDIAKNKVNFNLAERIESKHVPLLERESHSFVLDSDVIGRDEDKEMIIKLLIGSSDNETLSVVPIVGIGGLGKTTLAKLVYNDERVCNHFDLKMWICISEDFGVKKLILKIINSAIYENLSNLDMDRLQDILRDNLRGQKYLLVMDDVWREDPKTWNELKSLLSEGASGSKILVTTRSNQVASIMGTMRGPDHGYKLECLPYESCLSLFMKCAFREGQEKPHSLEKIGEEIVKKCGGIPLAMKTLGSLLYSSTNEHDWKNVRDNEIWKLKQLENDILPILKLSYDHLPSHLKICFTYCSIFPKDYIFDSLSLVQFWMAHGFLQSPHENEELEDVGLQYIKELVSRSFFQDFVPGAAINFKMHDLMHDLATSIAKTECLIISSNNQFVPKRVPRHLSFANPNTGELIPNLFQFDRVRTILFPIDGEGPSQLFVESCISKFKLLRVLDLSDSNIEVLPKMIGDLKHLRYLDLKRCHKLKKLPKSICKLLSLQTLLLGECQELKELSRDMRYLINLRVIWFTTKEKHLEDSGIGCLNSLRFLGISQCNNLEYLFEDISRLKFLRTIVIHGCPNLVSLPRGMKHLSTLENLMFSNCEKLDLNFTMESRVGDGHEGLNNPRPHIQLLFIRGLPKLLELPQWLHQSCTNSLQSLNIEECYNFMTLSESVHNLESLQTLHICGCPKLSTLPTDMHRLTNLRELSIDDCPTLSERCKPGIGEDWPKIAHIPKIKLDDKIIKSSNY